MIEFLEDILCAGRLEWDELTPAEQNLLEAVSHTQEDTLAMCAILERVRKA